MTANLRTVTNNDQTSTDEQWNARADRAARARRSERSGKRHTARYAARLYTAGQGALSAADYDSGADYVQSLRSGQF